MPTSCAPGRGHILGTTATKVVVTASPARTVLLALMVSQVGSLPASAPMGVRIPLAQPLSVVERVSGETRPMQTSLGLVAARQ